MNPEGLCSKVQSNFCQIRFEACAALKTIPNRNATRKLHEKNPLKTTASSWWIREDVQPQALCPHSETVQSSLPLVKSVALLSCPVYHTHCYFPPRPSSYLGQSLPQGEVCQQRAPPVWVKLRRGGCMSGWHTQLSPCPWPARRRNQDLGKGREGTNHTIKTATWNPLETRGLLLKAAASSWWAR